MGVVGAIVFGALGSGLWSTVFAPLSSVLIKTVLSLVTLGIEAAKDSVYGHAAFGFRERSGDALLLICGLTILSLPAFLYVISSRFSFSTSTAKTRRRIRHALLIAMALMGSILFVQLLMRIYANEITVNFYRTLAVAAPHISVEQRSVYLARFAKVRTRKDFVTVFGELNSILEKNGEPRSDFSPW